MTGKIIIKRDGSEEPLSNAKLRKVIRWSCSDNQSMTDDMMDAIKNRLRDRTKSSTLVNNLTDIAAKKIGLINTDWQYVAAKLLLLQRYHTLYNGVKFHRGEYPKVEEVFKGKQYSDFCGKYHAEELEEINHALDPKKDLKFTYSGLYYMLDKYAFRRELPQHVYMRVSMFLHQNEAVDQSGVDGLSRVDRVVNFYRYLSDFDITPSTPLTVNAGTPNPQLASCVLMKMGDSAESIMQTADASAIYSKHKGGIAVDISSVRPMNAHISGNNGKSSGPVPFVKLLESTITSFSQGGSRVGAMVVTFDWTHPQVRELIALKRIDGTEETRARHLKYSIRVNDFLMNAIEADELVKLIDPHKYPRIADTWGDEWLKVYDEAQPVEMVRARDLWHQMMTTRVDTGNLYLFHTDNVNRGNAISDRFINSSNLCQEVVQPSRASEGTNSRVSKDITTGEFSVERSHDPQEISLCTLSSINLTNWAMKTTEQQEGLASALVRALDNSFDLSFYPVRDAEVASKEYRYLGIGVFNYANAIARAELKYSSEEAIKYAELLMREVQTYTDKATRSLADERGVYPAYRPQHGDMRRNALVRAIAPTASSARTVNGTESSEPIQAPFVRIGGTANLPWIAPDFKTCVKYYENAFDIDWKWVLEHAIMRQRYLDQAQSINMYVSKEDATSAKKLFEMHKFAFDNGVKTLYYLKTMKTKTEEECESCT